MIETKTIKLSATLIPFLFTPVFAAKPINLARMTPTYLHSFAFGKIGEIREISHAVDFNKTQHTRIKQYYQGYPVWGADGVVHGGKRMNGRLYENLSSDLSAPPRSIGKQNQLIVYVDKINKAHWAYFQRSELKTEKNLQIPTKIVDAFTNEVYEHWDDLHTLEEVAGGGVGGNVKQGKLTFDGYDGDLPALTVTRDVERGVCYFENASFRIQNHMNNHVVMHYDCPSADKNHNNVYWYGENDEANGAYSPAIDALYGAKVMNSMYHDWYNMPPLSKDGKPMQLVIDVHHPMANASWENNRVTLGDSIDSQKFYPFTAMDVLGHEIGHGVTRQHSDLVYQKQSGGLNEAFSDMSAQAVEYYEYGKSSWLIGNKFMREEGKALRYMDQPSKDCYGKEPGDNCSIDQVSQYHDGVNVHKSSGIFNRVFYLMSTAEGWNTRRAYDVMLQANMYYWTPNSTFAEAACGVLGAAKDYHYDPAAILHAFEVVGIDTSAC